MQRKLRDWLLLALETAHSFPVWRARVTPESLRRDAVAAATTSTVMIPQGVAFAAIAGLPPEYGFYAALVPPLVAALFGSSWHMVSGPTAAISALVFSSLSGAFSPGTPEFVSAAITLAFLAGVFQLILGIGRLGQLADLASNSVLVGFTTGAALLIVLSQIEFALAVDLPRPQDFGAYAVALFDSLPRADLAAAAVALVTLLVAILLKLWKPALPNYLLALIAGTIAGVGAARAGFPVATVGELRTVLPAFELPGLSIDRVRALAQGALAVALVGLLEAVAIARSIASRTGQQIDPNREFIGQGLSNAVGSCFGAYPVSGSFTRTGVNVEAGARTPMAAVFGSLFLAIALFGLAPLFAFVPVATVAAVIMLSAAGLLRLEEYRRLLQSSPSDMVVAVTTLAATMIIGLEFAIYAGVLLSLMLFIRWTTKPYVGIGAPDPGAPGRIFRNAESNGLEECPQLVIARINGPLYFGAAGHLREQLQRIETTRPDQRSMLMVFRGVGDLDATAAEVLEDEAERRRNRGGRLHITTRLPSEVERLLQTGIVETIGPDALHESKGSAISAIVPGLDPAVCAACTTRIFRECPARS
jgi:SulP family sulfate permease